MVLYLQNGWFDDSPKKRLRSDVLDGAMDAARQLLRAGVMPDTLMNLALTVRSSMTMSDPSLRGLGDASTEIHGRLVQKLTYQTDQNPALQAFVLDCAEHVQTNSDAMAYYLHL